MAHPALAALTLFGGNYLLAEPVANSFPTLHEVASPPPVLETCEQCPQFPGGDGALLSWLAQELRYPESAEKNSVEGRVLVQFIVEKDGSISTPTIEQGVQADLDAEALRVVKKMPKWTPGKNKGETVRVRFMLPVTFSLASGDADSTSKASMSDKVLYVVNGKVVKDISTLPSEQVAEIRVDKTLKKVTLEGKTYDLEALGLAGVVYVTTK